jgi:acetoin utilization protein AcuB
VYLTVMQRTPIRQYMSLAPHTIGKDQTLETASALMREHRVRHLPVLDGGRLLGILSQRDVLMLETLADVLPSEVTVEEAMTPEPFTVEADTALADVVRVMSAHRYGAALVADRGRVVGIFTTVDALDVLSKLLD